MQTQTTNKIIIPQKNTMNTFLYAIRSIMEDIKRLNDEHDNLANEYRKNPRPNNFHLFEARAKHIERMALIGICSEFLIKAVLLKHGFVINKVKSNNNLYFSRKFLKEVEYYNENYNDQKRLNELYDKSLNEIIKVKALPKTLSFGECIYIFENLIIKDKSQYYPNEKYEITNPDTQEFYGKEINYYDALQIIQKVVRNNYVHLAESQHEQKDIISFLHKFLLYIAKKEFLEFFNDTLEIGE